MITIAGVDEAGRGCVIGPLVVAGVMLNQDIVKDLISLGVRDSKELTPRKRQILADEIKTIAIRQAYFDLPPWAIDKVVERSKKDRKLNYLEAIAMAKVIRDLRPNKAYIDAADTVTDRFRTHIIRVLPWEIEIVCEKRADSRYPVVSAASILAKVRRDKIINDIRQLYGDFGSGYPSDNKTIAFLNSWIRENDCWPFFVRRSWSTLNRIQITKY